MKNQPSAVSSRSITPKSASRRSTPGLGGDNFARAIMAKYIVGRQIGPFPALIWLLRWNRGFDAVNSAPLVTLHNVNHWISLYFKFFSRRENPGGERSPFSANQAVIRERWSHYLRAEASKGIGKSAHPFGALYSAPIYLRTPLKANSIRLSEVKMRTEGARGFISNHQWPQSMGGRKITVESFIKNQVSVTAAWKNGVIYDIHSILRATGAMMNQNAISSLNGPDHTGLNTEHQIVSQTSLLPISVILRNLRLGPGTNEHQLLLAANTCYKRQTARGFVFIELDTTEILPKRGKSLIAKVSSRIQGRLSATKERTQLIPEPPGGSSRFWNKKTALVTRRPEQMSLVLRRQWGVNFQKVDAIDGMRSPIVGAAVIIEAKGRSLTTGAPGIQNIGNYNAFQPIVTGNNQASGVGYSDPSFFQNQVSDTQPWGSGVINDEHTVITSTGAIKSRNKISLMTGTHHGDLKTKLPIVINPSKAGNFLSQGKPLIMMGLSLDPQNVFRRMRIDHFDRPSTDVGRRGTRKSTLSYSSPWVSNWVIGSNLFRTDKSSFITGVPEPAPLIAGPRRGVKFPKSNAIHNMGPAITITGLKPGKKRLWLINPTHRIQSIIKRQIVINPSGVWIPLGQEKPVTMRHSTVGQENVFRKTPDHIYRQNYDVGRGVMERTSLSHRFARRKNLKPKLFTKPLVSTIELHQGASGLIKTIEFNAPLIWNSEGGSYRFRTDKSRLIIRVPEPAPLVAGSRRSAKFPNPHAIDNIGPAITGTGLKPGKKRLLLINPTPGNQSIEVHRAFEPVGVKNIEAQGKTLILLGDLSKRLFLPFIVNYHDFVNGVTGNRARCQDFHEPLGGTTLLLQLAARITQTSEAENNDPSFIQNQVSAPKPWRSGFVYYRHTVITDAGAVMSPKGISAKMVINPSGAGSFLGQEKPVTMRDSSAGQENIFRKIPDHHFYRQSFEVSRRVTEKTSLPHISAERGIHKPKLLIKPLASVIETHQGAPERIKANEFNAPLIWDSVGDSNWFWTDKSRLVTLAPEQVGSVAGGQWDVKFKEPGAVNDMRTVLANTSSRVGAKRLSIKNETPGIKNFGRHQVLAPAAAGNLLVQGKTLIMRNFGARAHAHAHGKPKKVFRRGIGNTARQKDFREYRGGVTLPLGMMNGAIDDIHSVVMDTDAMTNRNVISSITGIHNRLHNTKGHALIEIDGVGVAPERGNPFFQRRRRTPLYGPGAGWSPGVHSQGKAGTGIQAGYIGFSLITGSNGMGDSIVHRGFEQDVAGSVVMRDSSVNPEMISRMTLAQRSEISDSSLLPAALSTGKRPSLSVPDDWMRSESTPFINTVSGLEAPRNTAVFEQAAAGTRLERGKTKVMGGANTTELILRKTMDEARDSALSAHAVKPDGPRPIPTKIAPSGDAEIASKLNNDRELHRIAEAVINLLEEKFRVEMDRRGLA